MKYIYTVGGIKDSVFFCPPPHAPQISMLAQKANSRKKNLAHQNFNIEIGGGEGAGQKRNLLFRLRYLDRVLGLAFGFGFPNPKATDQWPRCGLRVAARDRLGLLKLISL